MEECKNMSPEMKENLQDLKDIRNHMYSYYDVGQEYIRQQEILDRYKKAEDRWAPKNKKKILLIGIGICLLLGPVGVMYGLLALVGLYFCYEKITAEKISLRKKKENVRAYKIRFEYMSSKLENFPFIFCASSPSGFSSSAFFKSSTEPFLSPFISFARPRSL